MNGLNKRLEVGGIVTPKNFDLICILGMNENFIIQKCDLGNFIREALSLERIIRLQKSRQYHHLFHRITKKIQIAINIINLYLSREISQTHIPIHKRFSNKPNYYHRLVQQTIKKQGCIHKINTQLMDRQPKIYNVQH